MILGYLYIFLFFPVIVGMLSIDAEGNEFSPIAYILERLPTLVAVTDTGVMINDEENTEDVEEDEVEPLPELINLPPEISESISTLWKFMWFLGSQSKDLGVWIAMSTYPFHYVIAFLVATFGLFWYPITTVVAFFYLLITEWGEFRTIRKKDVI